MYNPAEQHPGEPVAWYAWNDWADSEPSLYVTAKHPKEQQLDPMVMRGQKIIADKPLYNHADPGEVDRLRIALGNTQALLDQANYHKAQRGETIDTLRAKLAERDALLRKVREPLDLRAEFDPTYPENTVPRNDCAEAVKAIDAALSASAEPSAPVEIDERPEGCCCPPKGYNGLWAAGPCPGHQGLRKLGQARASLERRP